MPVSTMTSQGRPVPRQRAICSAEFRTGRAQWAAANASSPGCTPWNTEAETPPKRGSAAASPQVETYRSRHPAAASRWATSTAPRP